MDSTSLGSGKPGRCALFSPLFGLNLALISGVFGSLALLISQFTRERGTAAGITGGLLVVFIVL